jgi:hypothetical protein
MADVNIYEPRMMLQALRQTMPPKTFFLDTFFKNTVLHETETVELDIYKGEREISVYVNPIHDGVVVERDGYTTNTTRPAYIKEKIPLRVNDTKHRVIGENIYNPISVEERAAQILGEDLAKLNTRLTRRIEQMCGEAITTGKVIVEGDGWDAQVDFGYELGKHKKVLTGSSAWDQPNSTPAEDLDSWRNEIVERCGIAPDHCIVGSKAAWKLIKNPEIKELMNNLNYHLGRIEPKKLTNGISFYGDINLPSGVVSLYSYNEVYKHPITKQNVPLVPKDMVILGSSEARCEMNYGLIQNIYALKALPRFPHEWKEQSGSARWLQLESAPMPNLYQVDAFTVAHVLSGV